MIINELTKLYDRLSDDSSSQITPLKFAPQKISFNITLKKDGTIFSITPASSSHKYIQQIVPEHGIRSGTKIAPQFMCDKLSYSLGIDSETGKREKSTESFDSFKQKHLAVEREIDDANYTIFCNFLRLWDKDTAEKYFLEHPEILKECVNFGVFIIQGEVKAIHESENIKTWWVNQVGEESKSSQCLITGDVSPIARIHPKIKGFESATALIGIQRNSSYESYQLEQGYTAPISEDVAFKYSAALNWLLDGHGKEKHRFYLADTTCVFWTDKLSILEDVIPSFFAEGSNAANKAEDEFLKLKINTFFSALKKGNSSLINVGENPDETNFYILGIEQPNPGRLSIRFFYKSSVSEYLDNLRSHHNDISIIREYKGATNSQAENPSVRDLVNQTALALSSGKLDYKTIPPLLAGCLMRSILENTKYPQGIYAAVLRRIRLDRKINYYRAAILKGVLVRNHNQKIPIMLDTENKDQAYLLGRLFATLEKTQEDALGDLNAGLRDKYYSSASATPAAIFPRIHKTYIHHLAKLPIGAKVNRDKLTQEIMSEFNSFPKYLNNQDQGKFAIGYYHQRKAFFTKKETTVENTETNQN